MQLVVYSGGDDDVYVIVYKNNILPATSAKERLINCSINFLSLNISVLKVHALSLYLRLAMCRHVWVLVGSA